MISRHDPGSNRGTFLRVTAPVCALALAVVLAAGGALVLGQSDPAPVPLERLVPEGTMLFVSMPDLTKAREGWKQTAMSRIYEEPEVKYAIDTMLGNLDEYVKQFEEQFKTETGVEFDSAIDIFKGQVSIAVIGLPAKETGSVPPAAMAVDFGSRRAETEKLAAWAIKNIKEGKPGLEETAVDVQGYKVFSLGDEDMKFFWCYTDSTLLIASAQDVMEGMIDRLKGKKTPSLADSESFKKVMAEIAPEGAPTLTVFANAKPIIEAARKALSGGEENPGIDRAMEALGVRGIDSLGLAVTFAEEGVRDRIFLHAPGPRDGLLSLVTPGVTSMPFLKDVPANVVSFSAMRLDLSATYDRALEMLKKADEEAWTELMEKLRNFEEKSGVRIRADLLASMGNEACAWSAFPEGGGLLPISVLAATIKDQVAFETSLQKLYAQAGLQKKEIEWMGRKVCYFVSKIRKPGDEGMEGHEGMEPRNDLMDGFMGMDPATIMMLNLTAFSSYFIEGGTVYTSNLAQTLKDFIRSRGAKRPMLADSAEFKALMSKVPAQSGMVLYYDLKSTFRLVYNTLLPILQIAEVFIRSQFNVPFETAALPTAESVAKHLTPSITAIADRPDGMLISSYSKTGVTAASIIGVFGAGVAAAIAVPALGRSRVGASESSAIATIRTIMVAQEQFKSCVSVDQDADGSGEYGFLQELGGASNCRSHGGLEGPNYAASPFIPQYLGVLDREGRAVHQGYYFKLFLPGADSAMSPALEVPKGDKSNADAQESRFCVYAWPVAQGKTGNRSFFINESGVIMQCHFAYSGDNGPAAGAAYDSAGANPGNLEAQPADASKGAAAVDGNFWTAIE